MIDESIMENLVRIGIVHSIDEAARKARVKYENLDLISDWLCVLQHPSAPVSVAEDGLHTHIINDSYTGGGTASEAGVHTHEAHVEPWMPKIHDTVVVVYLPVFDADGFILGVI